MGGALGDLEFSGDLCCCHLLALLQHEEAGHQPVGSHPGETADETGQEVTGFGGHNGGMTSPTSPTPLTSVPARGPSRVCPATFGVSSGTVVA